MEFGNYGSNDGISDHTGIKLSLDINFDTSDNSQTSYKAFVRTHGIQRVQLNGHILISSTVPFKPFLVKNWSAEKIKK
ncbi:hypothetical protein PIB30_059772 [Stylosanthes scabra]|uniref:Uncharacterized protein n=1 Tax=Stylosanthes scabra TaxID=79078 RepID=A0ABU6RL62_9FABA|nr:hypothetical protein [Stylosanthes scabra]